MAYPDPRNRNTLQQMRADGRMIDARIKPPTPDELRIAELEKADKRKKWNDFFQKSPVAHSQKGADLAPAPAAAAPPPPPESPPITNDSLTQNAMDAMQRGQISPTQNNEWQSRLNKQGSGFGNESIMDIARAMHQQALNQPASATHQITSRYGTGSSLFGTTPEIRATMQKPPAPPTYTNGQQKKDAAGNMWTYDAKAGRGVMAPPAPPAPVPYDPNNPQPWRDTHNKTLTLKEPYKTKQGQSFPGKYFESKDIGSIGGVVIGSPEWEQTKKAVSNNASLVPKPNGLTSRAYGGPVSEGMTYAVNDGGDGTQSQPFTPPVDGLIIPAAPPGVPGPVQEAFVPTPYSTQDAPPLPPAMDSLDYQDAPPTPDTPAAPAYVSRRDPNMRLLANIIPDANGGSTIAPREPSKDSDWSDGEELDFRRLRVAADSGRINPAERARLNAYHNRFFEAEQKKAAQAEANFKVQQHAADQKAIQDRHTENNVRSWNQHINTQTTSAYNANRADARQERGITATADAKKLERDQKEKVEEEAKQYYSDRIGRLQAAGTMSAEDADKMRKWSADTLKYEFERRDDEAKKDIAPTMAQLQSVLTDAANELRFNPEFDKNGNPNPNFSPARKDLAWARKNAAEAQINKMLGLPIAGSTGNAVRTATPGRNITPAPATTRTFATQEEALNSNLPVGTLIKVGNNYFRVTP